MTDYYVRQDGTAANKAAATSELSAATSMGLTQYHAETFSPGDNVYFSGLGGAFTTETTIASIISVIHAVSSGVAGNKINLIGISGALVDAKDTANSVHGVLVNSLDYILVKDIECNGSGRLACFRGTGTAGTAGDGHTVEFMDCRALRNYNEAAPTTTASDGFSSALTAQIILTRPYARKCRENPAGGGSNQAQTCHDDSSIKAYDVDYSDCAYAMVNTLNSRGYIERGTISAMTLNTVEGGGDATTLGLHHIKDATILVNDGGGLGGHTNLTAGSENLCLFENCDITITAGKISNTRGILHIKGGSLYIDSATNRIQSIAQGTSEGTIRITDGAVVSLKASNSFYFRTDTAGGNIQIEGCVINLLGGGIGVYFPCTAAGKSANSYVRGNRIFVNSTETMKFLNTLVASVSLVDFSNNSVNDASATPQVTVLDFDANALAHTVNNNIFSGVASVITDDGAATVKDGNVYFNCTAPAAPGTNVLTTDPLFTSPSTGDLTLQAASPMNTNGVQWWGAGRRPVGADGEPFSDYETSRGAYQSKNTPSHPLV